MADERASSKPVKFKPDGTPDGRGHCDGSKPTRFQKGDGRPRPGRPKRARSEKAELHEIMNLPVEITIGDRRRRVSTRQALFFRQREKALKGDQKAIEWLDRKFGQYEQREVDLGQTERLLAEDEAMMLADARARGILATKPEEER